MAEELSELDKFLLKIAGYAFGVWLLLVVIFNILKFSNKSKPESKIYKVSNSILNFLYVLAFIVFVICLVGLFIAGGGGNVYII